MMRRSPLALLEALGNRLPDPVVLFVLVALGVVFASVVFSGVTVEHPLSHEPVVVANLLSGPLARRMWTEATKNFVAFPPLGGVLVAVMGIGVAERSGLIAAALTRAIRGVSPGLLTLAMLTVGANAALFSDASFVVLVPLGATLWARAGRHPLAGLTIAYAAVSGGYGANFLVTALDPLLAGLTESAARLVRPEIHIAATCNWAFNAASVGVVVGGGLLVAPAVERSFGPWELPAAAADAEASGASLGPALGALLATLLGLAVLAVAVLRADDGAWTPVYDAIVPMVSVAALVPGLVWAVQTGRVRSTADAASLAAEAAGGMGGYIVLAFFAAQFVAWFNWSNLGVVSAVYGAEALRGAGLSATGLLLAFVALSAVLNLVLVSASAKWALMAPLFVPMLLLLGVAPEMTQAAYRVGDAFTNPVTPLMPYLPIVLAAARRHVPGAGVGTLLAAQLPFAVVVGAFWTALLLLWNLAGWPLGLG